MVMPAFGGTALSLSSPLPPRTCSSGLMVISSPAEARTTKASASIGTSPVARVVTVSEPFAEATPSETTSDTVEVPRLVPPSVTITVPSGL